MKRILFAAAAVAGLFVANASDAEAGWGGRQRGYAYGGGSHWNGASRYNHSAYGRSGYGHPGGYGYSSRWHDTSHFDYHPGTLTRHGNHFHYEPGHYDFHRTGHSH